MGWIAGDNQWADTDARRHGNPRMSCGYEHHVQSASLRASRPMKWLTTAKTGTMKQIMHVIEVTQPGVDTEARWIKKSGKSIFGYKQHTVVDDNGLVIAVETTAANCHDSKPLLTLLDKAEIKPGARVHADKAYCRQKHHDALKSRGIKKRHSR